MSPVDFALIQQCLAGNKEAWDEFVLRFSDLIYDSILRTFRRYGHPSGQNMAADLHNDIFVHILEDNGRVLRIFEGRNGCQLGHYLRTITVRRTVDYLRKIRPEIPYEEDDELAADAVSYNRSGVVYSDGLASLLSQEEIEQSRQLMGELGNSERELCRMIFLESLPPVLIADQLGITLEHFYVRKSRLLERLRSLAAARGIEGSGFEVHGHG